MPTARTRSGGARLGLGVMLLATACSTMDPRWNGARPPSQQSWVAGEYGAPSHYAQPSCVSHPLACAPTSASGDLLLATTITSGAVLIQGLLTLKEFLNAEDLQKVEQVLVECAREADFKINEQEYGRGNQPSDTECNRIAGYDAKKRPFTRAMELGKMKHQVAFACLQRELGSEFDKHLTVEPRYGKDPSTGEYVLSEEWEASLLPDVVLHTQGDATAIQSLYDFLFPCTSKSKSEPLGYQRQALSQKLDKYRVLPGNPKGALVTPQLGISK